MNPTLLVVCPTRNRPERCREMLESWIRTVRKRSITYSVHPNASASARCLIGFETSLALYVDELDPRIDGYRELLCLLPRDMKVVFGPRLRVPEVYNYFFNTSKYDYYSDANDDFIYHTPGWDEKLISVIEQHGGLGMAYGQTRNLPTAAVWSARSLQALGYWMPPGFVHQYVDNIHRDLFSMAGQMYHVPEVNTEHRHASWGDVPWDEGYTQIYKSPDAVKDAEAYEEWRRTRMAEDLRKLKSAK